MGVRLSNTHYSLSGVLYKVEVYDSDFSGTVSEFKDEGFTITWDNESDNFNEPLKPSSCRYVLLDDGSATFSSFRSDLVSAQENEFQLVVSKWNGSSYDLYWCGVIMSDMVSWNNENDPRQFEIIAKDGINRLSDLPFTNIDSSPFTTSPQPFMYIIEKCLAKNGLASFHTGDYIKVSVDWYDTQMSTSQKQRVFERVRIWGEMFRKDIDDTESKKTDVDPIYCKDVISSLLQIFHARMIYSEGCYRIEQVKNFTSSTQDEANYDNTGTYVTTNTGVSNQTTLDVLAMGKFGYHAPYNRVKLTARGYLDIRGAYIDKVEVDRSDTSNTETLQIGTIVGGVYATGSRTTSSNTNTFRAENAGTPGNSIALVFDGIHAVQTVVNDWNTANPTNKVYIASGANSIIHSAGTTTLSGGAGDGNRYLEIDFDVQAITNNRTKASNILTTVDVKLICGSYRIKNRAGYTNQMVCDWSTTAADKWSYTVQGYDNNTHKIQLVTPEIPFASESSCTCEITITLTKKDSAVWIDPTDSTIWPQTDWDFYATLRRGRIIAWDSDIDTLADVEVIIENPTNTANSLQFDYGKIIIGDNPLVQRSISSKNSFEVYNSLGTWQRPNVWDAGFDTDYNLVTTMLMETMALRKTPVPKYMGVFEGNYAAHKALSYDSTTWVVNRLELNSLTDEWTGTWFAIQVSRADITQSTERYKPLTSSFGLPPIRVPNTPVKDNIPLPINPKGKGAVPYEQGSTMTYIGTELLDNNHLKEGDSLLVYHPTTRELLHTFEVDTDTSVSDTSIAVVSDTNDADIPVGCLIEHNSKEVVHSAMVRADKMVSLGAQYIDVYTDTTDGNYQITVDQYVVLVDNDGGGLYNIYLPEIADCSQNGKRQVFIIKRIAGVGIIKPHTSDSAQIHHGGSLVASITMSGGAAYMITHDGTNWISLQIS